MFRNGKKENMTVISCVWILTEIVIWQAPRAGSMARAGQMERYCPPGTARFVPANKISPKFKQVQESFLSPKLFSAKVKRVFVISLSLWNQKKRQRE